jgi:hypothetical protein
MSLTSQIISGSQLALSAIKNYLANPSIAPMLDFAGATVSQDPAKMVTLQCESYKEGLECEVSQQLVVDMSKGKQYISDNIAPKPRTWDMKGYIGVALYETLASPLLQQSQEKSLAWLKEMRLSRAMLAFKTKNGGEIVGVGISSLIIDTDPLVQNRIPFTMTVREIPVLTEDGVTGLGIPTGSNNPSSDMTTLGTVAALVTVVATATTLIEGLV